MNSGLLSLDEIDENSVNEHTSCRSRKIKTQKKMKYSIRDIDFDMSPRGIAQENIRSLMLERPLSSPFKSPKVAKKRVIKVDKLSLAYDPEYKVPRVKKCRRKESKIRQRKINTQINVSSLSSVAVEDGAHSKNESSEEKLNSSNDLSFIARRVKSRLRSGLNSPLCLKPSKRNKPSTTTVTTNHSSHCEKRSSKSIIGLKFSRMPTS